MPNEQARSADPNQLAREANRLFDAGRLREAAPLYEHLLAHFPPKEFVCNRLAEILLVQGNAAAAIGLLRRSLGMTRDQPLALGMLGVALGKVGRGDEALAAYDQAIALQPGFAVAHYNRAILLADARRYEEAAASYARAIAAKPDFAEAHGNQGNVCKEMRRFDEALACYARALEIRPAYPEALNNRGLVLADVGRLDEAIASYDRALELNPEFADAHANRGNALKELGRFDDALAAFDRAIAVNPAFVDAHSNRGILLGELGRFDEAYASFERALARKPDCAEVHTAKAELLLLTGDYERGWDLFEWRWRSRFRPSAAALAGYPFWTGAESIAGKTVLLRPEVGFGDYLMFIRYARLMAERGARVLVHAPRPLAALFATLGGDVAVVEEGQPLPAFDLQCPIMSLPRAFRTTLQTIPARVPYLEAAAGKRAEWGARLGPGATPRIGVMWQGKADRNIDRSPLRSRSVPFECMRRLFALPLEFHSLQKETAPVDAAALATIGNCRRHDDQLADFADTAALIERMDLVISIDTSVAHLAGALGKPLWVMLPMASDYRWGFRGETTPWYPTATLFRQRAVGDWDGVVQTMVERLAAGGVPGRLPT